MSTTIIDKMKAFSLTHIVSIGSLLIFGIIVNGIYFYFAEKAGVLAAVFTGNFMWLSFVDIALTAAMSYYAVNFTVGAQGIVAETSRGTSTPPANIQLTPELLQAVSQLEKNKNA